MPYSELAFTVPDINLALNILQGLLFVALVVFAGPRVVKAKQQETELAMKDRIIKTREQDNDALRDHQATLVADLEGCRIDARRSAAEAATWKARYEEQAKYTAEAALTTIEKLIESGEAEAQRRHTEVMATLDNIGTLVGDRRGRNPAK